MSHFHHRPARDSVDDDDDCAHFSKPNPCDRLKPSFCPPPVKPKKGAQKIKPTDDSVFRLQAANNVSIPVSIEPLGDARFDVFLKGQEKALDVTGSIVVKQEEQFDVNACVHGRMAVEPVDNCFPVEACVHGELDVNLLNDTLNVKIDQPVTIKNDVPLTVDTTIQSPVCVHGCLAIEPADEDGFDVNACVHGSIKVDPLAETFPVDVTGSIVVKQEEEFDVNACVHGCMAVEPVDDCFPVEACVHGELDVTIDEPVTIKNDVPLTVDTTIQSPVCVRGCLGIEPADEDGFDVNACVHGSIRVELDDKVDVHACVSGVMDIQNATSEPFNVNLDNESFGFFWDKDRGDSAVPVFGQMEVCNACVDKPFRVELVTSNDDDNGLPLTIKQPLCVVTSKSCLSGERPARGGVCLLNNNGDANSDICMFGGQYPLLCAGTDHVCVSRVFGNLTLLSDDDESNFLLGNLVFFTKSNPDDILFSVSSISDWEFYSCKEKTLSGKSTINCASAESDAPNATTTRAFEIDFEKVFGCGLSLLDGDVLIAEWCASAESANFNDAVRCYELEATACRRPPTCAPASLQPLPKGVYAADVELRCNSLVDGLVAVRMKFCTVNDKRECVVTSGRAQFTLPLQVKVEPFVDMSTIDIELGLLPDTLVQFSILIDSVENCPGVTGRYECEFRTPPAA